MRIDQLRKIVNKEEVDYQTMLSALSDYANPRDKITRWLKSEELLRIKKGLYIFSKESALEPYSKEVLANLIYGPSAISLSYALSYYNMIPEKTTVLTSITSKRCKHFSTPAGEFTYQYLHPKKFAVGIELKTICTHKNILIASPEKALCDYVHLTDKSIKINNLPAMQAYLLEDLRLDENTLKSLRTTKLTEINHIYQDLRLGFLIRFIKLWKQNHA